MWANDRGHTETIFDCSCSPIAPYLCATASYDKVVKLWDMGSGECRCALCRSWQDESTGASSSANTWPFALGKQWHPAAC